MTLIATKAGVVQGSDRDDNILGAKNLVNTIKTGAGNDEITSNLGDDTIAIDGAGNKTINVRPDMDNDTITFSGDALSSTNTTLLKYDATTSFKYGVKNGTDLVIYATKGTDTVKTTIANYFTMLAGDDGKMPTIQTKVGTADAENIPDFDNTNLNVIANGKNLVGTDVDGGEHFKGSDNADIITTGKGDDLIEELGKGDDIINLTGSGAKVIEIIAGEGNDTIDFADTSAVANVTLKDIAGGAPSFTKSGNTLVITYATKWDTLESVALASETVKITNFFPNDGTKPAVDFTYNVKNQGNVNLDLENLFANPVDVAATTIKVSDNPLENLGLLQKGVAGTDYADIIVGTAKDDTITTGKGNDFIYAGAATKADTINITGTGTKTIVSEFGDGDQVINFASGVDTSKVKLLLANVDGAYTGATDKTPTLFYGRSVDGKDLIITRHDKEKNTDPTYNTVKTTIKGYFEIESAKRPEITISVGKGQVNTSTTGSINAHVFNENTYVIDATQESSSNFAGTEANETFLGSLKGKDVVSTGAGNDIITTNGADDEITVNGAGTKTININAGDGNDTIVVGVDKDAGNSIAINLAGGDAVQINYAKSGNDLLITKSSVLGGKELTETTTVKDYFKLDAEGLAKQTPDDIGDHLVDLTVNGTDVDAGILAGTLLKQGNPLATSSQTLVGSVYGETIYGGLSDDIISTGAGVDTIYAGLGDDTIVVDGSGVKTIKIGRYDGDDTIVLTKDSVSANIVLQNDVTGTPTYTASKDGNDLIISVKRPAIAADPTNGIAAEDAFTQTITVENYFATKIGEDVVNFPIDDLIQVNGTDVLTTVQAGLVQNYSSELTAVNYLGTKFKETITGTDYADYIETGAGADTVIAGGDNDTIMVNGAGVKTIKTGEGQGSDIIQFSDAFATGGTLASNTDAVTVNVLKDPLSVKATTLTYSSDGNDLIINKAFGDVKDGTVTIENYFNKDYATKMANVKVQKDGALETITNITSIRNADGEFVGTKLNDTITGDERDDVVVSTGKGADTIALGAGENTITLLAADMATATVDDKTINIDRKDGESLTTITFEADKTYTAKAKINFTDSLASTAPKVTYVRDGNDLIATAIYPAATGYAELVQHAVIENYFKNNEVASGVENAVLVNNVNVATNLTSANFTVSAIDGVVDPETGVTTITGTSGSERIAGTPEDDLIKSVKGADVILPGEGNDTVELGSDVSATAKEVILQRTELDVDDTTTIIGATNGSKTSVTVDFGQFDATKEGEGMVFTRNGYDLEIATSYAELGTIPASQNVVTFKNYFGTTSEAESNTVTARTWTYAEPSTSTSTPMSTFIDASGEKINYAISVDKTDKTYALSSAHALNFDLEVEAGTGKTTVTKTDTTAKDDIYTITGSAKDGEKAASNIVVTDGNGADVYNVLGAGAVSITDSGNAVDTYNISEIGTDLIKITDEGGADLVNFLGQKHDEIGVYFNYSTNTGVDKSILFTNGEMTVDNAKNQTSGVKIANADINDVIKSKDGYQIDMSNSVLAQEMVGWFSAHSSSNYADTDAALNDTTLDAADKSELLNIYQQYAWQNTNV